MATRHYLTMVTATMTLYTAVALADAGHPHGQTAPKQAHPHGTAGMHGAGHGPGHAHEFPFGEPGDPAKATRTVAVVTLDTMRYDPARVEVKAGETVKFAVTNLGKLPHEFVLGDAASLKEHAEMMRKMPDMKHEEPNMVSLQPGETKTLVWRFKTAGTVDFACLIPGHFEAGMRGAVLVSEK